MVGKVVSLGFEIISKLDSNFFIQLRNYLLITAKCDKSGNNCLLLNFENDEIAKQSLDNKHKKSCFFFKNEMKNCQVRSIFLTIILGKLLRLLKKTMIVQVQFTVKMLASSVT